MAKKTKEVETYESKRVKTTTESTTLGKVANAVVIGGAILALIGLLGGDTNSNKK